MSDETFKGRVDCRQLRQHLPQGRGNGRSMTIHIEGYSEKLEFNPLGTLKSIAGCMGLNTNVPVTKFLELELELKGLLFEEYGLDFSNDGKTYALTAAEGTWVDEWVEALRKLEPVLMRDCHIIVGCDEGIGIVCITPRGCMRGQEAVEALIAATHIRGF